MATQSVRIGWRPYVNVSTTTASTLWNSIYSVYNADAVGSSSLKTSLYAAYNGESNPNDSFGSNNGTAVGGLTYTTGKIGNAFTFNGTNAYVTWSDNSMNLTGDFTISLWVYPVSGAAQQLLNNRAYTAGTIDKGWSLSINNVTGGQTSKVTWFQSTAPGTYTGWEFRTTSLTLNAWNHVVITRVSGVDTYCWVNNTLQTLVNVSGTGKNVALDPTYHTTQKNSLGAFLTLAGVASNFTPSGTKVDGLNIWNKQLTADERTELYNSGNGAQYITDSFYKPTTNDALNTYNGTAQGGLTYTPGKIGTSFVGNGTNGYVKLPTGSFNSLTGDFSVSGWVSKRSGWASGDAEVIFNNMSATSWFNAPGGFWFLLGGDVVQLRIGDKSAGAGVVLSHTLGVSMPPANTFMHFVVTRKAGTRSRIYFNGNLITSNTNTIDPSYYTTGVNTTTPSIGSVQIPNGVQSDYFLQNGSKIDAVSVWNRELTAAEVTELYNSGNGKQYPN